MAVADKSAQYRQGSTRTYTRWTPSLVRSAEAQVESGYLWLAADLCEAMLTDDRIQGILATRTKGLLGLPLTFEEGFGRKKRRAVRALEVEEDWNAAYTEAELGSLVDWGTLLGVGFGLHRWERRGNRVIPVLETWHPRWFRYDWQQDAWFARVLVDSLEEVSFEPGDGQWVMLTPGGKTRPWARGAWRALARWWLLKEYARQDWSRHSELHGTPIRVGTAAEGTSKADRAELAADLADLGSDTALTVPFGWKIDLVEAVASTWEMFKAQIDMANVAISIILAGQNLTSNVEGGSRAAATVHASIRNDLIRNDAEVLSTTLHDQGLVFWADYNFETEKAAPWPVWDTTPPEDKLAKAQTDKAVADTLQVLKTSGAPINERAYLERYDLPLLPIQVLPTPPVIPTKPTNE